LPPIICLNSIPSDLPCEVGLRQSVGALIEPKNYINFTQFSLDYIDHEEKTSENDLYKPRFGGHPTLAERENSFHVKNQTIHCGFIKGPSGYPTTGFDLDEKDREYMSSCKVAVSSCIFGSSDFLRRPTTRLVIQLFSPSVFCILHTKSKKLNQGFV
jgi:hypothetical protein